MTKDLLNLGLKSFVIRAIVFISFSLKVKKNKLLWHYYLFLLIPTFPKCDRIYYLLDIYLNYSGSERFRDLLEKINIWYWTSSHRSTLTLQLQLIYILASNLEQWRYSKFVLYGVFFSLLNLIRIYWLCCTKFDDYLNLYIRNLKCQH